MGWGINLGGNSGRVNPTGGANGPQPGTYNLEGGLLQVGSIGQTIMNGVGPATFNFTGGTLQAAGSGKDPWTNGVSGLDVEIPLDLSGATSTCRIDMNGYQVNLQNLTTSSLTDLHFVNPASGNELLTIGSGYTLTVNPGTAISFGTMPSAVGDTG